ncbi:MAG: peptidoglycan DD-metalloendopeptidase family protein [Bacteroidia bacterium]
MSKNLKAAILLNFRIAGFAIPIITALISSFSASAQNPRFVLPIEGAYMKDYVIVNYVDWDTLGIKDYQCGSKTYDGHQGTDFTLRSFKQMDSGVFVVAVDTGEVFFVIDSLFDRNKVTNAGGLGNYIGISHSGKLQTYYAHLKRGSALVELDDFVLPGQRIGQVASSGNSTDPHLHFELYYDSLVLIDPFAGPCGNPGTYWFNPLAYVDSFGIIDYGVLNFLPTLDTLRERPPQPPIISLHDDTIAFWIHQYGIRAGDTSRIEWFDPKGNSWFDFSTPAAQDWWYYYWWSYITRPPDSLSGTWRVVYSLNNQEKASMNFEIEAPASIGKNATPSAINLVFLKNHLHIRSDKNMKRINMSLHNVNGQTVFKDSFYADAMEISVPLPLLSSGIYIVDIVTDSGALQQKFLID